MLKSSLTRQGGVFPDGLQVRETCTAHSQGKTFPWDMIMTEYLPQCYIGFTSPLYPQPFLQNRAAWLHTTKYSFTQAHLKHSFQPTMKQWKKVEISRSFVFQCHFLGHMQTLGK